jgi:hypothetical protein
MIAWLVGIVVYHLTNPSTLGSFFPDYPAHIPSVLTSVGGSIPSFAAAFIAYAVLGALAMRLRTRKESAESHA